METLAKELTRKYAFLQSTYWISQCAINSFAAVYLRSKGFDNTAIGIVLALASILSVMLQITISTFADKSKRITLRQLIIGLMLLVFVLSVILYIAPYSFWLIAINFLIINAIQFSLNPLFNPLAVEYINKGIPMNYGLGRGMGSISFAVMSYVLGFYVTNHGPGILLPVFLVLYCFVIASAYYFKLNIKKVISPKKLSRYKEAYEQYIKEDDEEKETSETAPTRLLVFFKKYKSFTFLLIGIAMLFYSYALINTYLINIMENVGGNSTDMGISLSISAALELPTMAGFIFLVRKIRCNTLVKISAFFFLIKIILAWLAPNYVMVHVSQSLQMVSFALFTPASVYYVNSIIEKQDKVKGQSMLGVAISFAAAIANITGGKILDTLGVSDMLLLGTIVTAFGFLLVCFTTKDADVLV